MATINNGLISGKAGNRVYFVRGGKQYMRELSAETAGKPRSAAQLRQQKGFAAAVRFLSPMGWVINGFFAPSRNSSALHKAVGYNVRHALIEREDGTFDVDAARVKLNPDGKLLNWPEFSFRLKKKNWLYLEWLTETPSGMSNAAVSVIGYNESRCLVTWSTEQIAFADGKLFFHLGKLLPSGETHIYVVLYDRGKKHSANALYLATLDIEGEI